MKFIYSLIAASTLVLLSSSVFAQQELTLHLLNNVYQSSYTNPAFVSRSKINVTPLSSYHLSLKNSGFTFNQIAANIEEDELGKRVLDLEKVYNDLDLNGKDYLHFSADVDIFVLAFKAGKNRISLNATEHILGRQRYDGSIFQLAIEGNLPGETLQLGSYELDAMHYREIGIGFNRPFLAEGKLRLGTRIKTVFGLGSVQTQQANISLSTGTEQELYAITANADVQVNTSGFSLIEEDEAAYAANMKNMGFGIDLGGTYRLNRKISFAASVINLGAISWKEDTKSYQSNGSFTFNGVEQNDLLTGGSLDLDVDQLTDSISNIFELEERALSYKTGLPTQMYLTGFYQLATHTTASATLYSDFYQSFRRGLSLGIRQNIGRWFQAAATYSLQSRSYNNLGVGFALTTGPGGLQLYFATDNVLALADVGNAKVVNLRTGFNFVF